MYRHGKSVKNKRRNIFYQLLDAIDAQQ